MNKTELTFSTPLVENCFNIFKDLNVSRLKEERKQLNNFNYKNCQIGQLFFEFVLMNNVTFENCKIGQLCLSQSSMTNIKFINCEIDEIIFQGCSIDISSLQEFSKFKKVDNNHCVLEILKTTPTRVSGVIDNKINSTYPMNCFNHILIHSDYIDNIGKSNSQLVAECIDIETVLISIGCQTKFISEWDDWFGNSIEEYKTPRNTEKFQRIENEYISFRDEALKIIENLKKGLN